ncbi:DUF551 domain-containing protein [Serratia marcescens]|uniref:DUF551 domain-containing protein n=1 Tax=Serratia marcescens TaxID=615 RepID=UPI0033369A2A
MKEELYGLANHIAGAKGGLPQEWQEWADEIEMDIRKLANREAQPVYQYRMRNPYNGQVTDWETTKPEQVDFILKETIAANVEFRIIAAPPAPAVQDGWIPCSEQTPVADGAYWCWFGKEKPSVIQQRVCIWNDRNHEWCDSSVTHWMPLPAAPEGGNG